MQIFIELSLVESSNRRKAELLHQASGVSGDNCGLREASISSIDGIGIYLTFVEEVSFRSLNFREKTLAFAGSLSSGIINFRLECKIKMTAKQLDALHGFHFSD